MKKLFLLLCFVFFFLGCSVGANPIKIVQFSDVHLDTKTPDKKVRKFAQTKSMFQEAIVKVNSLNPDIVVFSGDMVNKSNEQEFDLFLNLASELKPPYYPALGNHDVGVGGGMSKKFIVSKLNEVRPDLKLENPCYYIIKDDYIFIFMDGTTDKIISANGYFSEGSLEFLEKTLSAFPDKKAIIVQHFPLMEPIKSVTHQIFNDKEYFEILDRHKNVIMVLSGHYHRSGKFVRNNVLHISTPSMVEYPHAFRVIEVDGSKGVITIKSEIFPNEKQLKNYGKAKETVLKENGNSFVVKLKQW